MQSLSVVLVGLTAIMVSAQTPPGAANSDRKVESRVAPVFPELAKKMHIHGIVRIEATVRPNGNVKTARVVGGSPLLVNAALDAVGKWKFQPAQAETTEVVQLVFEQDQ